jgi:hypothetical protein
MDQHYPRFGEQYRLPFPYEPDRDDGKGLWEGTVDKDDAQYAVLAEWDRWSKRNPDDTAIMNGIIFFTYLEKEHPQLLDFRSSGDKWQVVHGWLLRARKVKE